MESIVGDGEAVAVAVAVAAAYTPYTPYTHYTHYTPYTPYTDRKVERCAAKFHAEPICQKSDISVLRPFRDKTVLGV